MKLRQCAIARGKYMLLYWLPEEMARAGNVVDLKTPSGAWALGWRVNAVYDGRPVEYVREGVNA